MQVLGLPGKAVRNSTVATRLLAPNDCEALQRRDTVRRWRQAMRDGLIAKQAAQAVNVPLSTLYRWERRPELLSRRPHRLRRPPERLEVRERIRRIRRDFPAWGRGKITAILRREGHNISAATVGRLIRDMVAHGRMAPVSAFTQGSRRQRRTHRPHAVRIRGPLMARRPGQAVQVDTLTATLCPGRAVKHFTAVDRRSRWGSAMAATSATASSTARFLDKLIATAPFRIEAVQVDGGSEFMAEFETACRERGIMLAVLPPKSPKMNGRVERMQATWRNEFQNVKGIAATRLSELNPMIDRQLEIYNDYRPHDALDGMTPNEYLDSWRISETPHSHM